jgi:hypothetical protein
MADDRRVIEQDLRAQLTVWYLRERKLAHLRWLAAASLPLWLEIHRGVLTGFLAWGAVLAQGYCLAMSVAYAALEAQWERRAALVDTASAAVAIHRVWTIWDDLRMALWHGLAAVSLVPWVYVAFHRRVGADLLSPLSAAAWVVLLLLAVVETIASRYRRDGREPAAAGVSRRLTWLGRHGPAG